MNVHSMILTKLQMYPYTLTATFMLEKAIYVEFEISSNGIVVTSGDVSVSIETGGFPPFFEYPTVDIAKLNIWAKTRLSEVMEEINVNPNKPDKDTKKEKKSVNPRKRPSS